MRVIRSRRRRIAVTRPSGSYDRGGGLELAARAAASRPLVLGRSPLAERGRVGTCDRFSGWLVIWPLAQDALHTGGHAEAAAGCCLVGRMAG